MAVGQGDRADRVAGPGGVLFSVTRRLIGRVGYEMLVAFLGIGLRDGTLSITASIAPGSPDCGPLLLSTPLRLSVLASGSQGEEISAAEVSTVPVGTLAASGNIEITKNHPYAFSVSVPASGSLDRVTFDDALPLGLGVRNPVATDGDRGRSSVYGLSTASDGTG
ncbi:hypothetical protein [Kitasatospora sp. NBC_00039]|uniref:hypothetical protein n=1 Tax=Kitasatospora sp. NBC_00039 TaxID=2903565 RepID=UPI00324E0042